MNAVIPDSRHVLGFLLECTVKSSVILAAALLAAAVLRRQSAAIRHLVWAAAVVSVLFLPVLTHLLPDWHADAWKQATELWMAGTSHQTGEFRGSAPAAVVNASQEASWQGRLTGLLALAWIAGAAIFLLRLLLGWCRMAWLASRARPLLDSRWQRLSAELGRALHLRRPVRLLESSGPVMPVTWGASKPRVLLPEGAGGWPDDRIRVVLSHELAHIQRHDWITQLAAEMGRALHWFNPLIWMGCNRLRQESERACDDAVLAFGVDAASYAEHLLDLARTLKHPGRVCAPALAVARPSNLEGRFIAVLNPTLNRRGAPRRAALLTSAAALCLILPLAALRAPAQNMSGRISGTVHDASGAVIPNATIMMANPEARTKDMTTSDAAGAFEFRALPAGRYTMSVLARGFSRLQLDAVTLESGADFSKDVSLDVGSVSESVDVVEKSESKTANTPEPGSTPHKIRVGGSVQETRLVNKVMPVYPPAAKAGGIEGSVLLEAVVAVDGSLLSLRVMNSQVDPDLARSAVEGVSQWRYQPTLLNGVPVEVITNITVNFRLSP